MEHCDDQPHESHLYDVPSDPLGPLLSFLSDSTFQKVERDSPLYSLFLVDLLKMSRVSMRYMSQHFCDDRLQISGPLLKFSLLPPLENYIRRLLDVLPPQHFVEVAMQTLLLLERLLRIFPRARTLNPHGLYLATLIRAAECGGADVFEELVHADTLFSREHIEKMMGEISRLLGDYSHRIDALKVKEMCHVLSGGTALPRAGWEGEVPERPVPMWSRLLCDKSNFIDQLCATEPSLEY